MRYVVDCLRFAAEIGAPLVQMLPSGETRLAPLATQAEEWTWSVEAMRGAVREAERLGVRIGIEPLNRYEAYLVTNTDEATAYLEGVGSPWVGTTLDLFHAHLEEPDPECADLDLPRTSLDEAPHLVLNNSSGFGGSNVSHVLRRPA